MRLVDHHGRLWRTGAILGSVALVALVLSVIVLRDQPTPQAVRDRVEHEAKTTLMILVRTPVRDAVLELRGARRRLRRHQRWLDKQIRVFERYANTASAGPGDAIPMRGGKTFPFEDLGMLRRTRNTLHGLLVGVEGWYALVRASDASTRHETWSEISVQAMRQRLAWPSDTRATGRRHVRAVTLWRDFQAGVSNGTLWPWRVVTGLSRRGDGRFNLVRRMFFPFAGRSTLRLGNVIGAALAIVAMGYCLCWLGARLDQAILSYAGIAYFAYLVVYVVCLILLRLDVLTG